MLTNTEHHRPSELPPFAKDRIRHDGNLQPRFDGALRENNVGVEQFRDIFFHDFERALGLGLLKGQPELIEAVFRQIEL